MNPYDIDGMDYYCDGENEYMEGVPNDKDIIVLKSEGYVYAGSQIVHENGCTKISETWFRQYDNK